MCPLIPLLTRTSWSNYWNVKVLGCWLFSSSSFKSALSPAASCRIISQLSLNKQLFHSDDRWLVFTSSAAFVSTSNLLQATNQTLYFTEHSREIINCYCIWNHEFIKSFLRLNIDFEDLGVLSMDPPRTRFWVNKYNKSRYQREPEGVLAGEDTTELIPNIWLIYCLLILSSQSLPKEISQGLYFRFASAFWLCSFIDHLLLYSIFHTVFTLSRKAILWLHSNYLCGVAVHHCDVDVSAGVSSSLKEDWSVTTRN